MSSSKKSTGKEPLSIVWLRRDLRLHDHAGFHEACKQEGRIQPVFIFDTDILARFGYRQDRRLTFLVEVCKDLHAKLKKQGGGLIVLHGSAKEMMPRLCKALQAERLIAARDVEPGARERDRNVYEALKGITEMVSVVDHLLLFPGKVMKEDGKPYTVFTPYSRKFREALQKENLNERTVRLANKLTDYTAVQKEILKHHFEVLDMEEGADSILNRIGYERVSLGEWGGDDAGKRLEHFIDKHVRSYNSKRNFPATPATSKLSPYLRFGLISIRECASEVWNRDSAGAETWAKELIWREFYAQILYHFPEVVTQDFQTKFRDRLEWSNNKAHFKRWCDGETGYPFVDAAMREINTTGWMHNRARMVVASFLTKHLRIDWRWGEEYFAQKLMDYDLASNNGGWQWAASTGTDAQPWFRVFNPILQSQKFDKDGEYIRAFVPELAKLDTQYIHEPWKSGKIKGYPEPIVEHKAARQKVLDMFKEAAG